MQNRVINTPAQKPTLANNRCQAGHPLAVRLEGHFFRSEDGRALLLSTLDIKRKVECCDCFSHRHKKAIKQGSHTNSKNYPPPPQQEEGRQHFQKKWQLSYFGELGVVILQKVCLRLWWSP